MDFTIRHQMYEKQYERGKSLSKSGKIGQILHVAVTKR